MKSKFVIRPEDVTPYSPANHQGTKNYRLVSPEVNGSKYLEIIVGDIERHKGAIAHAHPGLEQAVYVLEGEATAEIGGIQHTIGPGDLMFFPEGVFHDLQVKTERIKLLVIYSPPYGEARDQVIFKKAEVAEAG